MTMISLVVVPLLYFSVRFFGKRIEAKSLQVEEAESDIYTHTSESIENSDIIQSFNRQIGQVNRLVELLKQKLKLELDYTKLGGAFGFVNSSFTVLAITFLVLIGGKNVFAHRITFGDLLIFVTYAGYLFDPLQTLSGAIGSAKDAKASLKRVFEVINNHANIENTDIGEQLPRVKGQITFQNVSFSDGGQQILKNVNFDVKPGEKVALIGPSGSGKSTILRMIPRFLIPDSGFIYIDNHELHGINLKSLREQIAIVSQEPKLFSLSIAENIAFAHPDEKYPLPFVLSSAEAADANEFIEKLPDKFNTNVKQAGDSLSGGQKQRIAVARAFFKSAPILLLDEPTSAQDVASESRVLDGINRLMEGRTVVLVTHKYSLLTQMDKIYVVENKTVKDVEQLGGIDAYSRYLTMHERV
jgi:ABC-type multidrug transport system fused ATPase/permease subunit